MKPNMKMSTKQQKLATLLALVCLFSLIIGLDAALNGGKASHKRFKRQAATVERPKAASDRDVATGPDTNFSGQMGGASASASVLSNDKAQPGGAEGVASIGNKRRKKPKQNVELADDPSEDDEEERPRRVKKAGRRQPVMSRRPASLDEMEEDEDCHDTDDYDHGDFYPDRFHEAATRPMRHFNHIMEGMLSQMRGLSAVGGLAGGNSAVASASSSGDNFSRTSSMVTRNGRTRGIVTETKDGRTKMRRIDSGDDDEEED